MFDIDHLVAVINKNRIAYLNIQGSFSRSEPYTDNDISFQMTPQTEITRIQGNSQPNPDAPTTLQYFFVTVEKASDG